MIKSLRRILFLILIVGNSMLVIAQHQPKENQKLVVVIDPGHGGRDSGALSRNGIMEKDIVLSIALKIDSLYRLHYRDKLELYLTRYTDTLISLRDRTVLANKVKADVFISLHLNSSEDENVTGSEVYVYPKNNRQSIESAYLGFTIQKGLEKKLGIKNRGLRYGDFQVLRNLGGSSGFLFELGYLSNRDEEDYFYQIASQIAIASIIFPILN